MARYLLRRMILLVLVLFGMTVVLFTVSHVIPGDPAALVAGQFATPEQIEKIRHDMGLNRPLAVQYLDYISGLLSGDLGNSVLTRKPIREELRHYLPGSVELVLAAMLINVSLAVPLGILSSARRGGWLDTLSRLFAIVGVAVPVFWLGFILQVVFYGKLDLLPVAGRISTNLHPPTHVTGLYIVDSVLSADWLALKSSLKHLVLPATTLAFGQIAVITRMTRSSMLEVLSSDYIRTARSKGLRESAVVFRHAFKNAVLPILTIIGMQFGWMMGGTILVESIFSWGGLGFFAVTGILQKDFPAVMAATLVISLVFTTANLCVDLLYAVLDPRIKFT